MEKFLKSLDEPGNLKKAISNAKAKLAYEEESSKALLKNRKKDYEIRDFTKAEKKELDKLNKQMDDLIAEQHRTIHTMKEKDINKIPNKVEGIMSYYKTLLAVPRIEYEKRRIDDALESGEISKKEHEKLSNSVELSRGQPELNYLRKKRLYNAWKAGKMTYEEHVRLGDQINSLNYENPFFRKSKNKQEHIPEPKVEYKPVPKAKKTYKEQSLMKARSDLKKIGDKYSIDTDMNVRKGLTPKIQKALKQSIDNALLKNFKGGSINLDFDDSSSDDELYGRRRGRPRRY